MPTSDGTRQARALSPADADRAAATAALWESFSASLRAWFRRQGSAIDALDDLVQEVFVRLHQHIPAMERRDAVAAYVHRTARTVLADHGRHEQRRSTAPLDSEPPAEIDAPNAHAVAAAWLPAFFEGLPAVERDVLRLSELDGLPHRDIAARLGLSVSAVKSRVQRGRARLRRSIDACCELEFDRRGRVVDWQRHRPCDC